MARCKTFTNSDTSRLLRPFRVPKQQAHVAQTKRLPPRKSKFQYLLFQLRIHVLAEVRHPSKPPQLQMTTKAQVRRGRSVDRSHGLQSATLVCTGRAASWPANHKFSLNLQGILRTSSDQLDHQKNQIFVLWSAIARRYPCTHLEENRAFIRLDLTRPQHRLVA